jgi:ankyrin repeat protein
MKKICVLLLLLNSIFLVSAQNKNDLLYDAILKNDKETVEKQLATGASANYIKELSPWLRVSMLIAAVDNSNLEIVKLLIANKADVQYRDGFYTTAIMYAASSGELNIAKVLFDAGAKANDNDGKGTSVLSSAKESENAELIALVEAKLKAAEQ